MSFPNQLTILRIILTPVFVFFLLNEDYRIYAVLVFLSASLTDWYDGYFARKFGSITKWGKFLDPLADKILVLAAFMSFVYLGLVKLWMVTLIVFRDLVVTGLRSYAINRRMPIRTNFLAKLKTFSQMAMILFVLLFVTARSLTSSVHIANPVGWTEEFVVFTQSNDLIYILMLLVTIFTAISGLVYFVENKNHVKSLARFFFGKKTVASN